MKQLIEQLKQYMKTLSNDEKGATMVEYALMAALIAVVCIAAVTAVGQNASTVFSSIKTSLTVAT